MNENKKLWKAINNLTVRVVNLKRRVEELEDRAVQKLANVRLP